MYHTTTTRNRVAFDVDRPNFVKESILELNATGFYWIDRELVNAVYVVEFDDSSKPIIEVACDDYKGIAPLRRLAIAAANKAI